MISKEELDDFKSDYFKELQAEFLKIKGPALLSFHEVERAFDKYCREQYEEYVDQIRSKYG